MKVEDAVLRVVRGALAGEAPETRDLDRAWKRIPPGLLPMVAAACLGSGRRLDRAKERALRDAQSRAAVAYMLRSRVVAALIREMDEGGIPRIFLKGAALAEQVYSNPAFRAMSDVDVWVGEEDIDRVVPVLSARGFRVPERHRRAFPYHGSGLTVTLEPTSGPVPILVEVHSSPASLADLSRSDIDAMWKRTRHLASGMRVLDLPDQLVHVCFHATRGAPFAAGLAVLVDVALITRSFGDDGAWEDVTGRVRKLGRVGTVATVLRVAHDMVGAQVPDSVLRDLGGDETESVLRAARAHVWSSSDALPAALEHVFGGGRSTLAWAWRRAVVRHWNAAAPARFPARVVGTAARLARDVWVQLLRYWRLLVRGTFTRSGFWANALRARRRRRLLTALARMDRDAAPPG